MNTGNMNTDDMGKYPFSSADRSTLTLGQQLRLRCNMDLLAQKDCSELLIFVEELMISFYAYQNLSAQLLKEKLIGDINPLQ